MFRNLYDNDITVWSPQGRLHQVEYAMEAVKQGSACLGVKNAEFAVLAGVMRSPSELASYHKKVFEIDSHIGIAISGLTSDAQSLCRIMRSECLQSQWAYEEPLPVSRLVSVVTEKMQKCTQSYGRRPYGVGLLMAGVDERGPHIYQLDPSSNYFDCKAMAIGARSQSAKTYLERNLDGILTSDKDGLLRHALNALKECIPSEASLTELNATVAIVGVGQDFHQLTEDEIKTVLAGMDQGAEAAAAPAAAEPAAGDDAAADDEPAAMDTA